MRTLRGRLALGYAVALAATMFVFAATVFLVQRANRFAVLDPRVENQADLLSAIVTEWWDRGLGQVIVIDTVGVEQGVPQLRRAFVPRVEALLQAAQDLVVMVDVNGEVLFTSQAASLPSPADVERLAAIAREAPPRGVFEVVDLGGPTGEIRYFARAIRTAGPEVAAILTGASTAEADRFASLDPRVRNQADLITAIVTDAWDSGAGQVVVQDTIRNEQGVIANVGPVLAPRVDALLQSVQDFVVMVDREGEIIFATEEAEALPSAAQLLRLASIARDAAPPGVFGAVDFGDPTGEIRYFAQAIVTAGPRVGAILAGASTAGVTGGTQRVIMGMFASGAFILLASMVVGYVLAGRNLQPVDTIIDEIEAITDGRSLHRRVVQVRNIEELARLSTTLNAMLIRLERNFLSLRRFTADASHELKTPLTVLRAGVERAITHPAASPEIMEVLEETLVEVNLMTEIVDSLLTLARVDEGRAPLHLEPTDFRDLVEEIGETANLLGEQASVNVSVERPDRPLVIPLDRARGRQLLLNLVTNAIKYTPKGGRVSIRCDDRPESVVVQVADTGIGIATGDLPHVFDRFWRADAARSRGQRPGAGLGLAICRWIAEAHGGSIAVQSRRGEGTTFTVTLPKDTDELSRVAKS